MVMIMMMVRKDIKRNELYKDVLHICWHLKTNGVDISPDGINKSAFPHDL